MQPLKLDIKSDILIITIGTLGIRIQPYKYKLTDVFILAGLFLCIFPAIIFKYPYAFLS